MDKLVVNYYEYKHPIINKDLAIGAHGGKKFPTLGAWYDVINEYEFQTRCPIILKNSHRNKHFTFACHLKNCPFKVLLSYAGNAASSEINPINLIYVFILLVLSDSLPVIGLFISIVLLDSRFLPNVLDADQLF